MLPETRQWEANQLSFFPALNEIDCATATRLVAGRKEKIAVVAVFVCTPVFVVLRRLGLRVRVC
jgi:hypothetical protein